MLTLHLVKKTLSIDLETSISYDSAILYERGFNSSYQKLNDFGGFPYSKEVTTNILTYKVQLFKGGLLVHTEKSESIAVALEGKTGWNFRNYEGPLLQTADDMRYKWLWGVDLVAENGDEFLDSQLEIAVESGTSQLERLLDHDFTKKIRKTQPDQELEAGIDYTLEEDPYPYVASNWTESFGLVQMRHRPIVSVERADLLTVTQNKIRSLLDWIRIDKESGLLRFFPNSAKNTSEREGNLSFVLSGAFNILSGISINQDYPQGFHIDYTTGYAHPRLVPSDVRDMIGRLAAIEVLFPISDGLNTIASQSSSIDGISQSASSAVSATSGLFSSKILEFHKQNDEWLENNKHRFGHYPMVTV